MRTFITSDIHFSHTNIMKFCPESRKFRDVTDMDESIIRIWNSTVGVDDLTYILGDVAFCPAPKAISIVSRLNGRKILIKGNHDSKLVKDPAFCKQFEEVVDYKRMTHNGQGIVMFHYPIWEWDQMHRGAVHFHGHLHARPTGIEGRIFDVAMDGNNCVPYDMDQLIARVIKEPIRRHGDGDDNKT